jgi:alpha-1,2-mannosyltransferase
MGWAVAAVAASAVFMAWWLHWFDLVDLEVYRAGAAALVHGRDVYLARPRVIPLPFTYPPFAALAFVPLSVLPDLVARFAMSLVSGAALVFAALACLRLAAPRWPARARWTVALGAAAATPLIEPIRDTFRLGQVNLVLMALVLADLVAILSTDRSDKAEGTDRTDGAYRAASDLGAPPRRCPLPLGVLIGLATAVKLTPGIFILYLLVIRRTREAVTAMAAAVAATLGAWLLMPSESAHYWFHLVFDDRRIGSPGTVWNQSLRGALARLTGSPDRAHFVWLALALVVMVVGLGLAARLTTTGDPLLGLGVAALTGLLVSPISWNHHWVWFLPLALGLGRRAVVTGRASDWWVAGGWVATFCLASISWWPFAFQDDYHLGALYSVAADCYVLAAMAAGGLLAWRVWFAPPVSQGSPQAGGRS